MTEQEVLARLEIPDFRHLTKDKVLDFASMLSDMDPAVAQKALEQFPDFSKTLMSLATDVQETYKDGLKSNSDSVKACHEMCQQVIAALSKRLDNNELSFEEQKFYVEKMFEATTLARSQDSGNKDFLTKVLLIASAASVIIGGFAAAALGGKINIKFPQGKA